MTTIDQIEKQAIAALAPDKRIPRFAAGDTIQVQVRVREGSRERLQLFEGVCIARAGSGIGSSFTVRKLSYGEGVERVFPLHSPLVNAIKVKRRGRVRRAKLYYLRPLRGKAARIAAQQGQGAQEDMGELPSADKTAKAKDAKSKDAPKEKKAAAPAQASAKQDAKPSDKSDGKSGAKSDNKAGDKAAAS